MNCNTWIQPLIVVALATMVCAAGAAGAPAATSTPEPYHLSESQMRTIVREACELGGTADSAYAAAFEAQLPELENVEDSLLYAASNPISSERLVCRVIVFETEANAVAYASGAEPATEEDGSFFRSINADSVGLAPSSDGVAIYIVVRNRNIVGVTVKQGDASNADDRESTGLYASAMANAIADAVE